MIVAVDIPMTRCTECGKIDAAASTICSCCLNTALDPCNLPGVGKLISWTTIRRAPMRFRDQAPYNVCVVELDSGHRVTGRLLTVENAHHAAQVVATSISLGTVTFEIM